MQRKVSKTDIPLPRVGFGFFGYHPRRKSEKFRLKNSIKIAKLKHLKLFETRSSGIETVSALMFHEKENAPKANDNNQCGQI